MSIEEKVEAAIRNLRFASHAAKKGGGLLNVCYSGGKDSDVILALTKMANRPYRVSHNLTTLDAPETIRHIMKVKRETEQDHNCVGFRVIRPKKTFTELIEEAGFPPTRKSRYCCQRLKEGNNGEAGDMLVFGVRAEESNTRKDRKLFQITTKNSNANGTLVNFDLSKFNKLYKANKYNCTKYKVAINAIVDWTLDDVIGFIDKYNIEMNPIYEKQGGLHTRCGCICCPLSTQKNRIPDITNYPMQWQRILKSMKKVARNRGYSEEEDYYFVAFWLVDDNGNKLLNNYINSLEPWEQQKWQTALFSLLNEKRKLGKTIEHIVDYFEDFPFMQNEIAWEKAHDPRIRICSACNKRGKITPEIKALNMKLYGREIQRSQLRCIDCLAKELDTTVEQLEEQIEQYRASGCELF